MSDINKVVLVGRLTRDCEMKQIPNTTICNFSIAVNRKIKQGENWVDEPSFFDLVLFGNLGPALQSYLVRGQQVAVEGALKQDRWEAQDGQKRSKVVVIVNNVQLVGGRPQQGGQGGYQNNQQNAQQTAPQGHQQSPPQEYSGGGGNPPQQNNNFNQNTNQNTTNDFQDDIPF